MHIGEIEQISFIFIDQHIDATFDELPEDLYKIWRIAESFDTYFQEDYYNRYEFRIFRYALEKYEREKKTSFSPTLHKEIFKIFQLMLSIPALRNPHLPRETAFRVFDFQLYSELI